MTWCRQDRTVTGIHCCLLHITNVVHFFSSRFNLCSTLITMFRSRCSRKQIALTYCIGCIIISVFHLNHRVPVTVFKNTDLLWSTALDIVLYLHPVFFMRYNLKNIGVPGVLETWQCLIISRGDQFLRHSAYLWMKVGALCPHYDTLPSKCLIHSK